MVLKIAGLKEGVNSRSFSILCQELELNHPDLISADDGTLSLTILKHGNNLFVGGEIAITIQLRCARCLQNYPLALKELFEFGIQLEDFAPQTVELWESDLVKVNRNQGEIKLDRRVRDGILLAIPTFPLCALDCKGLCPICGTNLNIHQCDCSKVKAKPRKESPFSKLKVLFQEERSE